MVYLIFFLANRWVARTIDTPTAAGTTTTTTAALLIDTALLTAFALAHSVMARDGVKRRLARLLPRELERSTYALVSALLLSLVFWQWRGLPEPVWTVEAPQLRAAILALGVLGWLTSLLAIHVLGHLELFGLAQAWAYARREPQPPEQLSRRGLHGHLRHPIYLGFLIGIWATPEMSQGHLLFSSLLSVYILVGMRLEESGLERRFGEAYRRYRLDVGGFVPRRRQTGMATPAAGSAAAATENSGDGAAVPRA